ncbi:MAG: hypothetical protein NXY57DRAFT_970502 [Lentinula lateritia]|nr:MAG: hypothetical protein NXY57DRAFT_970502 [Lentinula lateritia]
MHFAKPTSTSKRISRMRKNLGVKVFGFGVHSVLVVLGILVNQINILAFFSPSPSTSSSPSSLSQSPVAAEPSSASITITSIGVEMRTRACRFASPRNQVFVCFTASTSTISAFCESVAMSPESSHPKCGDAGRRSWRKWEWFA